MNHTILKHTVLAVSTAATVAIAWQVAGVESDAPIPTVTVDLTDAPRPEPVAFDRVLEYEPVQNAFAKIQKLRAEMVDLPAPESSDADALDAFRKHHDRKKLDFVELALRAPELADAEHLLRSASLNPRDVALDTEHVRLLTDLLEAHQSRFHEIASARGKEATRLMFELAEKGEVHAVEDVAKRLTPTQLAKIDADAAYLHAKLKDQNVDYETVLASVRRSAIEDMVDADATMIHAGREFVAPNGSLKGELDDYDEFRRFLATELFADVVALFAHGGSLSGEESARLSERYFARAWPSKPDESR